MSYQFTAASLDSLIVNSSPVVTYPFSFFCWLLVDNLSGTYCAFSLGDKDTHGQYWAIQVRTTGVVELYTHDFNGRYAYTSNTLTAGGWHSALAVCSAVDLRRIVLDGAWNSTTLDRVFADTTGADRVAVGVTPDTTPQAYFQGQVAECAIWDRALVEEESDRLTAGVVPWQVAQGNLVFYAPLLGTPVERLGPVLTAAGAVAGASHPRVFSGRRNAGIIKGSASWVPPEPGNPVLAYPQYRRRGVDPKG